MTIFSTHAPCVLVNPRHAHTVWVNYSSHSVCLSVTTLAATYLIYMSQVGCHRVVVYGVFKILVVYLFAENASFKSSGVIF